MRYQVVIALVLALVIADPLTNVCYQEIAKNADPKATYTVKKKTKFRKFFKS